MDENFVEVNNTPSVEITDAAVQSEDLLTLPDTFSLFARTTLLKYTLTIENQDTIHVTFYVDDKPIKQIPALQGTVSLYAPAFSEGYHKLRMEVITNTGTGSLADRVGAELMLWKSREWTFLKKRVAPQYLF